MRSLGIYSGTFDPVHAGHIAFARAACDSMGLQTVVFIPERHPRHKPLARPVGERIRQLETALSRTPFYVLDVALETHTVNDLIPLLQQQFPDTLLTFLVGSDVAIGSLPHWKHLDSLPASTSFAVGMRAENTQGDVKRALRSFPWPYQIITTAHPEHASSKFRTNKKTP